MAALPDRFDPLGAHPMCGKEKASLRYAEVGLFQNATFALASLDRTSKRACRLGEELVRSVEAKPLWIEAAEHDRWVAASSHLPYLVASALARSTPEEVAPLVGPGFRSTTRLAGSSARMMADILATNRVNIRTALARFRLELDRYDALLERETLDEAEMVGLMEEGAGRYHKLCG
jgi:prephenate dehydrogenase